MRRYGLPFTAALPFVALLLVPVAADDPPAPPIIMRRAVVGAAGGRTAPVAQLTDEAALKEAGLNATEPGPLLEYLKARTLTDADQSRIGEVITRFGVDAFDERAKATEEVEKFGSAAIGPLKAAAQNPDPEVAYRARAALKRMEKVPHSAVASAAVRSLVKLKPKGAAEVLIGFLPMADTDEVAEDIRAALVALAITDGRPDPALIQALGDKSVIRRGAAYIALIESGAGDGRKEALPLVTAAVRKETDTDTKFRGLWALLLTTREKAFVPELIDLIPQLPRGRIWQLEEFLVQAAGAAKPAAKFGKTEASLAAARDAWAGWWKEKGGAFDLAKFEFTPRITGHTDVIDFNPSYGLYRVVTLGPDEKEKRRLGATGVYQLSSPADVKKLPNGNYLIAEQNGNRITERDSTSRIVKTTSVSQPLCIDLIADGGMVVVGRNQVIQYDKDGKQVWQFTRPRFDIVGGRRMPNGDVVFVTQWDGTNQPNIYRLGAKDGKEVGKAQTLGRFQQYQSPDATGDNTILLCEPSRVVEYDLKAGKEVWKYEVSNASSCQRLPNGNTLITYAPNVAGQPGKVIEVETGGDIVWDYTPKDNMRPTRAFRR